MLTESTPLQVLALIELYAQRESGKYSNEVYLMPKHLDEEVARLHLPDENALTVLVCVCV